MIIIIILSYNIIIIISSIYDSSSIVDTLYSEMMIILKIEIPVKTLLITAC